jgi:hypothetical protein
MRQLIYQGRFHPIPLLASPLKGEEACVQEKGSTRYSLHFKESTNNSLPFKGRVGVGMGSGSSSGLEP